MSNQMQGVEFVCFGNSFSHSHHDPRFSKKKKAKAKKEVPENV